MVYLFLQGSVGLPLPSVYDFSVTPYRTFQKYAPLVYQALDEQDPKYLIILPEGEGQPIDDPHKIPGNLPIGTMIIPAPGDSSEAIRLG